MPNPLPLDVARYGLAVVPVALAAVLRLEVDWTLGANPPMLFLFVIPVGIAAWYGGFGPGVAATVAGGAADILLFNTHSDRYLSTVVLLRLGLYVSTGLAVSYIGAELRAARRGASESLAALIESEARYRGILESVSDGVWQTDPRGRTVYANTAMARMLGYTVDEMLGRPWADFAPGGHAACQEDLLAPARSGVPEPVDARLRRENGTTLWVLLNAKPLLDGHGEYAGAIATATDISERRRREDQTRALSARLQSAREEEASRIAREIHDELGASLTGLRWDLE